VASPAQVWEVRQRLADLSAASWTNTATGVAVELGIPALLAEPIEAEPLASAAGISPALARSLADALVAAGLAQRDGDAYVAVAGLTALASGPSAEVLRADLRTGLLQMAALFDDATRGRAVTGWSHTDERILQAQGVMSAGAVELLATQVFPRMDGMLERLDSGAGVFLDVGAGVAAISIALCRRHPRLRAVALEPQDAPRRLAEHNVSDAGLSDRVQLRAARVEDLHEHEAFDLVWLPGNFLPADVLRPAMAAIHAALRPGGYVLNACLGGGGDDQRSAAARLRAVLWGGETSTPEQVGAMLSEAGFADVELMPRLPSGLVPMQARRR
jgi:SAM-dependent methyltransferase